MARGFVYLVAIIDWYSRRVLSWRLSNTLDTSFCVEALEEALDATAGPRSSTPTRALSSPRRTSPTCCSSAGIKISMDGKGRCIDNIFVERLWRSLKYEEVYLYAYDSLVEARDGIGRYFDSSTTSARTRRSATRRRRPSTSRP